MTLFPDDPSKCHFCAADHRPDEAHNNESLFYQTRFHIKHGRFPTWADAVAHCFVEIRKQWKQVLIEKNVWSEPEDGKVIAEKDEKLNARCHFCGSENIILSGSCKTCRVCGESSGGCG